MRKILLVDNDITFIWGLKKYLQRRGYAVETAATLAEAREIIRQEPPLRICSDLCLPDGTALELFHDIRRISEKFKVNNPPIKLLPFFTLTASIDFATEYQYQHKGISDYITTPVNISELIWRILFFVE